MQDRYGSIIPVCHCVHAAGAKSRETRGLYFTDPISLQSSDDSARVVDSIYTYFITTKTRLHHFIHGAYVLFMGEYRYSGTKLMTHDLLKMTKCPLPVRRKWSRPPFSRFTCLLKTHHHVVFLDTGNAATSTMRLARSSNPGRHLIKCTQNLLHIVLGRPGDLHEPQLERHDSTES
jgi:hypothetical protein